MSRRGKEAPRQKMRGLLRPEGGFCLPKMVLSGRLSRPRETRSPVPTLENASQGSGSQWSRDTFRETQTLKTPDIAHAIHSSATWERSQLGRWKTEK